MTNPFRMPRRRLQREFDFARGEYLLPRKVRRWLEKRLVSITNLPVRLAAVSLATMIGRYHTGPRVNGRDFFLCRQALPGKFADEKGAIHSEWHLRLARAELQRLGFIERVTPVGQMREIKGGRFGRWLRASKEGSGIRSPKVMFRLGTVLKRLFSEALQHPDQPTTRRSPVWSDNLYRNLESLPVNVEGLHTGEGRSDPRREIERRAAEQQLRELHQRSLRGLTLSSAAMATFHKRAV